MTIGGLIPSIEGRCVIGKPKAPKAPDPRETAAAQTATNVGTAIANQTLGNVNQVTPDGALTYTQTGTKQWKDPTNGANYDLPIWTATQTLSPGQQAIKDQTDKAETHLATLAADQSGRLNELLGKPVDTSGAPAAGDPSKIGLPQYAGYNPGPNLQTSLPNAGNIQSSIAGAGNIQRDVAGAGPIQTSLGNAGDITKTYDASADTARYENALMDRLNPQLQRSRSALETQLANQGLQPGSEAYNRALDTATRQENDARIGVIMNAGQEQSRQAGLARDKAAFENAAQGQGFQQALAAGGFANQAQNQQYTQNANNMQQANAAQAQQFSQNAAQLEANNTAQGQKFQQGLASTGFSNDAMQQMHQNANTTTAANNALNDQTFNAEQARLTAQNNARTQYLNELYAKRNQGINETTSLLSGAQVNGPNFVNTQGVSIPNTDLAGLIQSDYQNKLGAWQQRQQSTGGLIGGLLGFGGQLASLSDKRAKKDIERVGELKGHGLYSYRYRGRHDDGKRHIGVIAQDVEKKRPEVVSRRPDGLRQVDYGALFLAGRKK